MGSAVIFDGEAVARVVHVGPCDPPAGVVQQVDLEIGLGETACTQKHAQPRFHRWLGSRIRPAHALPQTTGVWPTGCRRCRKELVLTNQPPPERGVGDGHCVAQRQRVAHVDQCPDHRCRVQAQRDTTSVASRRARRTCTPAPRFDVQSGGTVTQMGWHGVVSRPCSQAAVGPENAAPAGSRSATACSVSKGPAGRPAQA